MLLAAIASFVMLVIVVYLIAAPLARGEPADRPHDTSALLLRKERLLSDIRDLDMDLVTGKLEEHDHRRLRTALLREAAETLRALEEAGVTLSDDGQATAPGEAEAIDDARLEALIAARKRAIASPACPSCGAPSDPEDAFCRRCGTDLATGRETR